MSDSLQGKTIESLGWKLFERGGRVAVELLVQIVMARLLAPEYFGMLAIMLVFVNFGSTFVQSGLNAALIQAREVDEVDYSTVFWIRIAVASFFWTLIFFAAPFIADFYDSPQLVWPLRVLAFGFVFYSWKGIQTAKVGRNFEYRKTFVASLSSVVISGVLGVVAALAGMELWALVIQNLSHSFVYCVVLSLQVRWHPHFVFSWERARALSNYGWKILATALLDTAYSSLSDLIIGKQFSTTDLGYVSQGQRYPRALGNTITEAINPVMLSTVARVQDDVPYVKRVVRRSLKTATFVVFPVMTLFAVGAEPLVLLLIGEAWLPAVPMMQIYSFVFALKPHNKINTQTINGMGRSDLILKLNIVKKVIGVVILLIAAFVIKNIYAIVFGVLLETLISTFVNAWPNRRLIGYSYTQQVADILPSVALSAVAALAAWPLMLTGLPSIVVFAGQVVIMGIVYLGLAKLFKVESYLYLEKMVAKGIKGRLGRRSG